MLASCTWLIGALLGVVVGPKPGVEEVFSQSIGRRGKGEDSYCITGSADAAAPAGSQMLDESLSLLAELCVLGCGLLCVLGCCLLRERGCCLLRCGLLGCGLLR